ncbi:Major facilitator superfamily domain, general substrate transporter [Moelleriella libera RCEF 2490]|uniref:Major facilitator superfamily domain, general substrate transporter n=1 Tax=Moelleriella libera RCEF 2490 TaxID=1081109 RepID=A0A168EVX3_9HYPO|nr:Major facilitator superfamily domain, general substrate transporter [Moelleriella libera RCEF 2490]
METITSPVGQQSSEEVTTPAKASSPLPPSPAAKKSLAFWLVIVSLCLIAFMSALDGSIIAIALPHISSSLNFGDKYVGVANCFVFAQTVAQPGIAQLCNIFGRRWPMIISVCVFAVGSGVAGGANDATTMIAGRTVQGLGSGGIMLLVELIVCDMVPLRERGKYLGIVLSVSALGSILGPVIGGAIVEWDWRWCFYLSLPACGVVLPVQLFLLRIKHLKVAWREVVTRVDWTGNVIFIGSVTSLLIGLTFGGAVHPWSSWRVIVPIVVGGLGWAGFHWYEYFIRDREPCVPPNVFSNRTSGAAFYMIFITSTLLQWVCFFWPVYFMAILGESLVQTGVDFLPFTFLLVPGSAVAGILLSKTGRYRRLHFIGFALSTLGPGLNTLLRRDTHAGGWAMLQMVDAVGRAFILPTTLPAILASLPEKDVAAATGVYSFLRSFGFVWGITIPSLIFNHRFDRMSDRISDTSVRDTLGGGRAYEFATGPYVQNLPPNSKSEVLDVYLEALKAVWFGAMALGATGLIAVAIEKHVPLRTDLETEYGLQEKRQNKDGEWTGGPKKDNS